MLKDLSQEDRLRLMKFVCSFAWADLEVQAQEKTFVRKMMRRLELDEADRKRVEEWLEVPPPAEEIDPLDVPHAHRQIFLDAARAMILADGRVDDEEVENLALLEQLLA